MKNFEELNIDADLLRSLKEGGIETPTPIQAEVIPLAREGRDLVAQAPTGSGKTLAFAISCIEAVDIASPTLQVLILCPTRELAMQTADVFRRLLAYREGLRVAAVYGGENMQKQLMLLRKRPQIIVGTPGRVCDHVERHTVRLASIRQFVLDEGDEMLDMGFREQITDLMSKLDTACRKMMFSATMPTEIKALTVRYLNEPIFCGGETSLEDAPDIKQYYTVVSDAQRVAALIDLIAKRGFGSCLVFCNTRTRAERLAAALVSKSALKVGVIHGELNQRVRSTVMRQFRLKELDVLVATDVAARGIDVDDIEAIINFDPPTDADFYVHRIGRTARANKSGAAITFVDKGQMAYITAYAKRTGVTPTYFVSPDYADAFTLPRDGSNKLSKLKTDTKRFFLNVGSRDLLDKDTLAKLVCAKTGMGVHEITDVKVRDVYSFVEVVGSRAEAMSALKGVELCGRKINIELASVKQDGVGRTGAKYAGGGSGGQRSAGRERSFSPRGNRVDDGKSERKDKDGAPYRAKSYGGAPRPKSERNDRDGAPYRAKSYGDAPRPKSEHNDRDGAPYRAKSYGDAPRPKSERKDKDGVPYRSKSYGDAPKVKRDGAAKKNDGKKVFAVKKKIKKL